MGFQTHFSWGGSDAGHIFHLVNWGDAQMLLGTGGLRIESEVVMRPCLLSRIGDSLWRKETLSGELWLPHLE